MVRGSVWDIIVNGRWCIGHFLNEGRNVLGGWKWVG